MGHPAGQSSHRLHLLGLAQALLQGAALPLRRLALRDVADGEHPQPALVQPELAHRDLDREGGTVGAAVARGRGPIAGGGGGRLHLGVEQVRVAQPAQLLALAGVEPLGGRVGVLDEPALRVHQQERVRGGLEDPAVQRLALPEPVDQLALRPLHAHLLGRVLHLEVQGLVVGDRLGDVVVGADLDRLDGGVEGGVAGDQDHLDVRLGGLEPAGHVQARPVAQVLVHQRHVDVPRLRGAGHGLAGRPGQDQGAPLALQEAAEHVQDHRLVVDDEQGCHVSLPKRTRGRWTRRGWRHRSGRRARA